MISGIPISQGYMVNQKNKVVRVRLSGDVGFLTIKGATCNASRKEFEYPVPQQDAKEMQLLFCKKPLIEKTRYKIDFKVLNGLLMNFPVTTRGLLLQR